MTNDKTLLAVWKENLLTELKQSLLWDAIPYDDLHRIDFTELNPNDQQFPFSWMRSLLDEPTTKTTFSPVPSLAKKIKHLYYEAQAQQKELGTNTLKFGYPLFVKKDKDEPKKYIAAPLFTWEMELRPSPTQPGDWIIERKRQATIQANPFLNYYLKKEYDLDMVEIVRDGLANQRISQLDLLKVANEIALKASFEGNNSTTNAVTIPTESELVEILMNGGNICWSGIIGLFQNQSVQTLDILDAEIQLPDVANPTTDDADFRQYDFSPITLDPYQSAIIKQLDTQSQIVVTGGHGTGKTHTVSALTANLLANKKKTLIISNKTNALETIQNQLDKIGLGELTLITSNPFKEKRAIAEAIYQTSLSVRKLPLYEEEDFQHLLNRCNRSRTRLDSAYQLLSQPIFEQETWTELVGSFIKNQEIEGKHLLNSHLKTVHYQFSKPEYDTLKAKIERAELLYNELNTLKHPLRVLHPNIFTDKNHEDAKSFTYDTLSKILDEVGTVYRQFVVELEHYTNELNGKFEDYYQGLKNKIAEVRADISDYKQQYGDDFNKNGIIRNTRMKLFSVFSKRLTNILDVKSTVKSNYDDIEGSFEFQRYFAYSFPKVSGSLTFDKLNDNLNDFEQALEEWKAGTSNLIQQELVRLDSENINEHVDFKSTINRLNQAFASLITSVNGYELYQKKFHSEANTLIQKRTFLESMTENLENLQYNLRDFDAYYFWTNYWLKLTDEQKSVVKSLITTKPKNWMAAFNSWYFHSILTKQFDASLLSDSETLDEYHQQLEQLKDFLPKTALKFWKLKQANDVRRVKRESKFLYNVFFGKSRERFVDEFNVKVLFDSEFEMLTNMFPAIMMPPHIASEWLPAIKGYFDVVIVDNAENIQTEDAVGGLWRGKKQVILGDELQIGNRMVASSLTYAKQSGYEKTTLPLYHTATDEQIWNFKNAAFYNNELGILPSQKLSKSSALKLVKIEGVYIPQERINEEEAQQVMHLLNEIEPNKAGRFPSVGIVCMTKEQRNLMIYYINQIKQRKIAGYERIIQLELGGLNVLYYKDLQSHHFDVVILSTTFGIDVQEKFSEDIQALNELDSLQALNAIISTASEKTYLLTSIPTTYIEHYSQQSDKVTGIHILANYINYATSIMEADEAEQVKICNQLLKLHKSKTSQKSSHNEFVKEVSDAIQPYLEKGRLSINQQIDGIHIDMLIEPIHVGQPRLALQSDASFWRFPQGNYEWEKTLAEQLNGLGITYQPVWSLDFWKNPELAVKQLASFVIKYDEHYLPKPPAVIDVVDALNDDDSSTDDIDEPLALDVPAASDSGNNSNDSVVFN
ncbi:MAG: hypothetical protein ACPGXZ_04790 [Saprospiraceae bacterium]